MDIQESNNIFVETPLNFKFPTSHSALRLIQINIRGMNNFEKFDSLRMFIKGLNCDIDVIVIGETWVKQERSKFYCIPGYKSIFSCRNNASGGLGIFVKETMRFNTLTNTTERGFHHIAIKLHTGYTPITLHSMYRPPDFDFNFFANYLENIVATNTPDSTMLLVGDMNIAINSQNRETQKYSDLLSSYNMMVTNSNVTRPSSNNILDHVVCNTELMNRVTNFTIDCAFSDHSFILTDLNIRIGRSKRRLTKTRTNFQAVDADFRSFLENFDFSLLAPSERLASITGKYRDTVQRYSTTYSVDVMLKKDVCPWMNLDIWKLSKMRDNLLKRKKRFPTDQHTIELLQHVNRKLIISKRNAKRSYYQRMFSTTNHRALWRNINELISEKKQDLTTPSLVVNQTELTEPSEVANIFNEYFSSVGRNLANRLTSNGDVNCFNTMRMSEYSMFMFPASSDEVQGIITSLDVNKATGCDGFPISALKKYSHQLSPLLSDCFNICLSTGVYPDCLKQALVYPVFKSDDPKIPTNYRPISVLPSLNKVFEKMIVNRLNNFFASSGYLYQHQFGFRTGSSSETAVVELVDEISSSLDQRHLAGTVFLDLSKAFDSIDHNMLLNKLDYCGVRGLANQLIRSYLSNRYQQVVINETRSNARPIEYGVPQGSNLGPLLFLVFVNDLPNLNLYGKPRLFADDTVLSYSSVSVERIVHLMKVDLERINRYLENNLLALNLKKTKMMIFRHSNANMFTVPQLCVDGQVIDEVSTYKYLGIFLDNKLRWDVHIRQIISQNAALCGILRKLAYSVPQHVLMKIYHAFIHSRYQYGITVWGSCCKTFLKELQVQQNRCLKGIFKLPHLTPSLDLYNLPYNKVLPILGLFFLRAATMMHKIQNRMELHHNFQFSAAIHHHHTRNANLLTRRRFNTEVGRRRFSNYGPQIYNRLPNPIKQVLFIVRFKFEVKRFIRENLVDYMLR